MILFYDKRNGDVFGCIDGRVHSGNQLVASIDNGIGAENIEKFIIGWVEDKGKKTVYNKDKFDVLQKFEDISPESPLMYKVAGGDLIKK